MWNVESVVQSECFELSHLEFIFISASRLLTKWGGGGGSHFADLSKRLASTYCKFRNVCVVERGCGHPLKLDKCIDFFAQN